MWMCYVLQKVNNGGDGKDVGDVGFCFASFMLVLLV